MSDPDAPLFDATLRPHRSLGPKQFRILMAVTFCASAALSLPFYLMGAWPIIGFLGLDALTTEDPSHPSSGMYGFEDQRAALCHRRQRRPGTAGS